MMPPCQRYPASPGVPIRLTARNERPSAVTVISRGTGAGFIACIKAPAGALAAVPDDLGANSTVIPAVAGLVVPLPALAVCRVRP